jgi:hypothetical protein
LGKEKEETKEVAPHVHSVWPSNLNQTMDSWGWLIAINIENDKRNGKGKLDRGKREWNPPSQISIGLSVGAYLRP